MTKSTKTLQPVDANIQRGNATPGTKMRHLTEENEALRGNIDQLTKVIGKLDFAKEETASVAPSTASAKDGKAKKCPVVPAKTAYKFWCEKQSNKKHDDMQKAWKNEKPAVRSKFQALAKADKERFITEMNAYNEEQKALEMYREKQTVDKALAFYNAHLEAQAALEKVQEETGKGKKKKKAAKDADAPKRPTSSYMYFAQEMRAQVKEANPEAPVTEIAKILGANFKELSEKAKKKYDDMAEEDRERYSKEKAIYDAKVAERKQAEATEKEAKAEQEKKEAMEFYESQSVTIKINNSKDDVSVISDLSGSKQAAKKKKDPNAPKKALSAYNYFMKENRESIKAKMPAETKNTEVVTEIGKQWKALSEAKKKKYNKMAAKDQERYAKEMEAYKATKN